MLKRVHLLLVCVKLFVIAWIGMLLKLLQLLSVFFKSIIKQFKILKAETCRSIVFSRNIIKIVVIVLVYPLLFMYHSGMSHVNRDPIV